MLKRSKTNTSLKNKFKLIFTFFIIILLFFNSFSYAANINDNIFPMKEDGIISDNSTENITTCYDTVHVSSNRGNDVNPGDSWFKPVKTIERALKCVNNNGVIVLDDGVYYSKDIISKNVTISSDGGEAHTIISSGYIAPIIVSEGCMVCFKGVSFVGRVSQSGSIVNQGKLSCVDCVFFDCSGVMGGAVCNDYHNNHKSLLICNNCVFEKCSSTNGGAIYNNGDAYFLNCDFRNNTANLGGAIYNRYNLKVTSSYFKNNYAGRGGATYNEVKTSNMLIRHCSFQDNIANQGKIVFSNAIADDHVIFMDQDFVTPEDNNNYAGPVTILNGLYPSRKVTITVNPINTLYGYSYTIKGVVKSEIHPKLVIGLKDIHIQIFIDNKYFCNAISDENGEFEVEFNSLMDPGVHILKCVFPGNERYNQCIATTQISVKDWRGSGFIPQRIVIHQQIPMKETTNSTNPIEQELKDLINIIIGLTAIIVILFGLVVYLRFKRLKNK